MDARDRLRQIIDERQGRLAAGIPPDREAALLAVLDCIDRLPSDREVEGEPDLLTGRQMPGLGAATALGLCLESPGSGGEGSGEGVNRWSGRFLGACRDLEAARLVLRLVEAGELRLAAGASGEFHAWFRERRVPSFWRERADIDRWARTLSPDDGQDPTGAAAVSRMAYQLPYPADGEIGGIALPVYRAVLSALIDFALHADDGDGGPLVVLEAVVVGELQRALGVEPELARRALSGFVLDADNAGWHGMLPAGPPAPLVRLRPDRLAVSRRGLRSEPFFFLLRELRRRDPDGYHNAAGQREVAFRQDLNACFADRRFVTSAGRIVLRRDDRRNRTDVDAAVFDRKTGTLGLFELKAQDPFARTAEELARRRENLRQAGHQVAAVLDWINRKGADEVLNRMDRATAKRFRVQRVLPFVLGRYLGDAGGGAANGRIAWGSWGQVLRQLEGVGAGNPLAALHSRLIRDDRSEPAPADRSPVEIGLGQERLAVYPDWAAVQAARG